MADYTVTSLAELNTRLNAFRATPPSVATTVDVQEADYSGAETTVDVSGVPTVVSRVDATGIAATAYVTFQAAVGHNPVWPGVCCDDSSYLDFDGITFTGAREITATTSDPFGAVCRVADADHIKFRNCTISADAIEDSDFTGYVNVSNVTGTFTNGETVDVYSTAEALALDVATGGGANVNANGGTGIYNNTKPRSSASVFAICGDASDPDAVGTTCAGTTGGPNPNGGQSYERNTNGTFKSTNKWQNDFYIKGRTSGATAQLGDETWKTNNNFLIGIWGGGTTCDNLLVEDCTFANCKWFVGCGGQDLSVQRNRGENFYTSPFDFHKNITGLRFHDNEFAGGWSKNTDCEISGTDGAHSSIGGFSQFSSGANSDIKCFDNICDVGLHRYNVLGQLGIASGWKWNDMGVTDTYSDLTVAGNIWISTDPIGTQWSSMDATCRLTRNTHIFLLDRDSGGTPALYYSDCRGASPADKNIVTGFAEGTNFSHSDANDIAFLGACYDNIICLPRTASTSPASLASMFDGLAGVFTGPTPGDANYFDDLRAMFTPKTGGRAVGYGHHGFDRNSIAAVGKPETAVSTGVDIDRVGFDGSQYFRYTRSPDSYLFGLSGASDDLTIVLSVKLDAASDGSSCNLLYGSSTNSIWVRRLANGRVKVYLKYSANYTAIFESSFTLTSDDGLTTIAITVSMSDYKVYMMKGPVLDGLTRVTTWTENSVRMTDTYQDLSRSSGALVGEVALMYLTNEYLDLTNSANHDKLVALDGAPCGYGADGSTLTGTQPKVYLKGNATAWNDVAGINLGSAARKFIKQASDVTQAYTAGGGGDPPAPPPPPPPPPSQGSAYSAKVYGIWL